MPANLSPEYKAAEAAFRKAHDPQERLAGLREMLRTIPKHKGTDHLQADMKTKIAKLKKQVETPKKAGGTRQATLQDYVEREGAGQIILIGPPNARPTVGDYPYTTREPLAAMMTFESIQLQLIDTPPISTEQYENYLGNLIRNADIVLLVCDLTDPKMIESIQVVLQILEEKRIILKPQIDREPEDPRYKYQKTLICAHKCEDECESGISRLKDRFPDFKIVTTSILEDGTLDQLKRALYESLAIIRVFTKQIGKEVDPNDSRRGQHDSQGFRSETQIRQGLGSGEVRRTASEIRLRALGW